jgi:hypothetical protein
MEKMYQSSSLFWYCIESIIPLFDKFPEYILFFFMWDSTHALYGHKSRHKLLAQNCNYLNFLIIAARTNCLTMIIKKKFTQTIHIYYSNYQTLSN